MHGYPVGSYYAVAQVCAVDFNYFDLPLSRDEIMSILGSKGFINQRVDMAERGRASIGVAKYQQDASDRLSPEIVNCKSFIKWLYGQKGILLPCNFGGIGVRVGREGLSVGDLVYVSDPGAPSGGHVGMATNDATIIHATREVGVTETSFYNFIKGEGVALRMIKRIIATPNDTLTFLCPPDQCVVCSNDIVAVVERELRK